MSNKRMGLAEGFEMSQHDVAIVLGLNQRTVSKAERSMITKLKGILSKHSVSEAEFFQYLKYQGL